MRRAMPTSQRDGCGYFMEWTCGVQVMRWAIAWKRRKYRGKVMRSGGWQDTGSLRQDMTRNAEWVGGME